MVRSATEWKEASDMCVLMENSLMGKKGSGAKAVVVPGKGRSRFRDDEGEATAAGRRSRPACALSKQPIMRVRQRVNISVMYSHASKVQEVLWWRVGSLMAPGVSNASVCQLSEKIKRMRSQHTHRAWACMPCAD